jgi:hypothetical protein
MAFYIPVVHARIITLHFQSCIRSHGLEHEVVVAVWAELVTKKAESVQHNFLLQDVG